MKTRYKKLAIWVFASLSLANCEDQVTDFGFNGTISGTVNDNDGNPLHGDLSSNNLVVNVLGEGDKQPTQIRVDGEGLYQNLKIFPKTHKVWLEGPIIKSDTVSINFSEKTSFEQSFTVVPLISPKIIGGSPNGTSISVEYEIIPNNSATIDKMEIYASTVKYPTAAIGSNTNVYFTKVVTLTESSGTIVIDGLEADVTYFIRIGALADGASSMNYSNQIIITTN